MRSAGAGKDHAVIADHRTAAQRGKADVAGAARAGVAVAALHRALIEVDAAAFRRRAAQHQRGAGRRIDFPVVMHFEDLDVEILVERPGDLLHQRRQQIDAEAHIAGLHHDGALGRGCDQGLVLLGQPGRADDMHQAVPRREFGKGDASPRAR